jgi:hypothetical protein
LRQSNVLNNKGECAVSWQCDINKIKFDGINIMILDIISCQRTINGSPSFTLIWMEVNAFGEMCNKNMLLMNKKSADLKTVLIVIQNFLDFVTKSLRSYSFI